MKAEAYKEWSEMYLEDVPGGKLQLDNDLDAAVEVDYGRGWRILYPKQKRQLAEESFSIRLREDQAVMSTIGQGRASGPEYCLRTSKDLEAFSAKASSWVANEQKAVQKETEERQRRKQLSEAKVERSARKHAAIVVLCMVCLTVAIVLYMAWRGRGWWSPWLSHFCAGLGMALLCFLLYLAAPRTRRCVCMFEAVKRISRHVFVAGGMAATVVSTLYAFRVLTQDPRYANELEIQCQNHPAGYLLFVSGGAFFGTWARSMLPDGQAYDSLRDRSRGRLLEETIVFQGTVMEEQGKPCIKRTRGGDECRSGFPAGRHEGVRKAQQHPALRRFGG